MTNYQIVIIIINLLLVFIGIIHYVGIKLQMKISDALYKKLVAMDDEMKRKKISTITMKIEPSDELKDLIDSLKDK